MSEAVRPDEVIFVMDSSIGQAVYEQATAFKSSVPVGSVIVTKLDGHAKGGGALSAVAATEAPITFIGTGEHFANFEAFNAESFISRLLGRGDIKGLFRTVAEAGLVETQEEMMKKLTKGKPFSLRDLYEQLSNILKMGDVGNLMSMIPGMANIMPAGSAEASSQGIQQMLIVMDSMTSDELDGIVQIENSEKDISIAAKKRMSDGMLKSYEVARQGQSARTAASTELRAVPA